MIEGKVWGTTQEILKLPTCSIHRLEVKQGGYCSEHVHRAKFNMFFVESGVLMVTMWHHEAWKAPDPNILQRGDDDTFGLGRTPDVTILRPGASMTVEPGKAHKFEAVAPSVVFETYWVELTEDIERRTQGGIRKAGGSNG